MTRFPDWQSRLNTFLNAEADRPFAYGAWDCCIFVCDAVQAMTGEDLAEDFRGKYSTRREAMQLVRAACGVASIGRLMAQIAEQRTVKPVAVAQAQRGDVVLVKKRSLGLVALNGYEVLGTAVSGIWRVPLTEASAAWRI